MAINSTTTSNLQYVEAVTTEGSMLGNSTADLVAFHGSTPIAQAASANQAIATDAASVIVLANALRLALVNKGLIKGAA